MSRMRKTKGFFITEQGKVKYTINRCNDVYNIYLKALVGGEVTLQLIKQELEFKNIDEEQQAYIISKLENNYPKLRQEWIDKKLIEINVVILKPSKWIILL